MNDLLAECELEVCYNWVLQCESDSVEAAV